MGLGKQVKNGHQTTKSSAKNASEKKHWVGMPKTTTGFAQVVATESSEGLCS